MTDQPAFSSAQKKLIEQWIRPELRELSAYHVPDASGLVKLDAMENPYGFPDSLMPALQDALSHSAINRYPDPAAREVKQRLLEQLSLPDELDVMFGNGSDELIQLLLMAVGGPGRSLLSVEPAFVMYRMTAIYTQTDYVSVPLKADFSLDEASLAQAIEMHQPAILFLAQPNNPTGNLFEPEVLRRLIKRSPGLVVLDEAYLAFTDSDCLSWLQEFPNLLVMRTFSKVGLAGLRFGMLFGAAAMIEQLNKLRMPYNVNTLTQAAVSVALEHFEVFEVQCQRIRESRSKLMSALSAFDQLTVFPSEANFVLVRLASSRSAADVAAALREQGILIKCLQGAHPLLDNCLRLTVGSESENTLLVDALFNVLQPE